MKHPHAGGRYYRDKDGTLTRAGEDGEKPKTTAEAAPPAADESEAAGKAAKRNLKDKGHA